MAPKNIPWNMIRSLITEMYGGKIDDEEDFQRLSELVGAFMTAAAFEEKFNIIEDVRAPSSQDVLALPSGTSWKEFMDWTNGLPEREPPAYLGLPANAEKLLLIGQANEMIVNLRLVMNMLDEGEQVMAEAV